MIANVIEGTTKILCTKFDVEHTLETIQKYKVLNIKTNESIVLFKFQLFLGDVCLALALHHSHVVVEWEDVQLQSIFAPISFSGWDNPA